MARRGRGTKVPEVLGESNYKTWSCCMKNYLISKGLWEVVDGTDPEPPTMAPELLYQWRMRNAKALHAIQVSCSLDMFTYISNETFAKSAWESLKSIHLWFVHRIAAPIPRHIPPDLKGMYDKRIPYMKLYKLIVKGDLTEAKKFLNQYPNAVSAKIAPDGKTALHTAILHKHWDLAEELVKLTPAEDLERSITYKFQVTPLHLAAIDRNVKVVKAMVEKNMNLLPMRNSTGYSAICFATFYHSKDVVRYLYSVTPGEQLDGTTDGATLVGIAITVENYDFALELLAQFPRLATTKDNKGNISLNILAKKCSSFYSGIQLSFWQTLIYRCCGDELLQNRGSTGSKSYDSHERNYETQGCDQQPYCNNALDYVKGFRESLYHIFGVDEVVRIKIKHCKAIQVITETCKELSKMESLRELRDLVMPAIFQAIEAGNLDFVVRMIKFDPSVLWYMTEFGGIFHVAIAQRQDRIWNLIHCTSDVFKKSITIMWDRFDNNLLHVAGKLAPSSRLSGIAGPALQLQSELQWFKAVENVVEPMLREQLNIEGKTPQTLFSQQHKALEKEAKTWMKETATSLMLVATLIATVMYEGARDVPGKADEAEIFRQVLGKEILFHIFMTSDAVGLISSTIAVLMFLSILTSSYTEEDFLLNLPRRMIIGLATLFLSIANMMLTFGITIAINMQSHMQLAFPYIWLVSIPAVLYAFLNFPLFLEMIKNSYQPAIFSPDISIDLTDSGPSDIIPHYYAPHNIDYLNV